LGDRVTVAGAGDEPAPRSSRSTTGRSSEDTRARYGEIESAGTAVIASSHSK
jgi:hypothetical protein